MYKVIYHRIIMETNNRIKYKFDGQMSILDLSAGITEKIITAWDTNPEISNWRAVILKAEHINRNFIYR